MVKFFERAGERMLRSVLPQVTASAYSIAGCWVIYSDGDTTLYQCPNGSCVVDIDGGLQGAVCP